MHDPHDPHDVLDPHDVHDPHDVLDASPFRLRPFVATDAPAFVAAVRESMDTVGTWMPWAVSDYDETRACAWFARCASARANGSAHEFGVFDGDVLLGGAGLNRLDPGNALCNLGYWIRASGQRRGAAVAATRALTRFAFDVLGLVRVEIVVAVDNEPSHRVALRAGARYECTALDRLLVRGSPVAADVFRLLPREWA